MTSSEFRDKIKELGYEEKGSELTSGGELNADFLEILIKFFEEWKSKNGNNCLVRFTSGNDSYHKRITKYVSRHTKGEAVDVTLDSSCHVNFEDLLSNYKTKYKGFSFINEYKKRSSQSTGGHFHISYRAGQPEGKSKTQPETKPMTSDLQKTTTKEKESGKGRDSSIEIGKQLFQRATGSQLQEEIKRIKELL